jgi:hypothetical protein
MPALRLFSAILAQGARGLTLALRPTCWLLPHGV